MYVCFLRYEFLKNATYILSMQREEKLDEASKKKYNHQLNFVTMEMNELKRQIDARIARDMTGHELYKQASEMILVARVDVKDRASSFDLAPDVKSEDRQWPARQANILNLPIGE